jgi:hypothetical protein
MRGQNLSSNTTRLFRSASCLVAVLGFICATAATAGDPCRPALAISNVRPIGTRERHIRATGYDREDRKLFLISLAAAEFRGLGRHGRHGIKTGHGRVAVLIELAQIDGCVA